MLNESELLLLCLVARFMLHCFIACCTVFECSNYCITVDDVTSFSICFIVHAVPERNDDEWYMYLFCHRS